MLFTRKPSNLYYNNLLRFSITKPADWVFQPQKNAPLFNFPRLEYTGGLKKILAQQLVPFVCFYKKHSHHDLPLPTVQCGCRLNHLPKDLSSEERMERLAEEVSRPLESCEILKTDPNFRVDGHPAMMIRMKFQVKNEQHTLDCLGRVIIIPWNDFLIVIGMTGAVSGKYRCEDEFKEILSSIRLNTKRSIILDYILRRC